MASRLVHRVGTAFVGALAVMLVVGLAVSAPAPAQTAWSPSEYHLSDEARAHGPHILLIYDMEGVSGQDDILTAEPEHVEAYARGRRLLTDDVNAVVRGLFDGGARSVAIIDGHGGGNRQIDVLIPEIDRRAEVIRRVPVDAYSDLVSPGAYDALVAVAMHAKSGSGGFWAHTYTYGIEIAINGHALSESEMLAMAYGTAGIPLIFVSGDDVLGESLKPMSWLEYVTVKKARGPSSAELTQVKDAHQSLQAGAKRAVRRLGSAKVVKTPAAMEVNVRALRPWDGSWLRNLPGVRYIDNGIAFHAGDFGAAYRGIEAASSAVVIMTYYDVMERAVSALPNHAEIQLGLADEYNRLWLEGENERAHE
jgi:D-amino peptidase